MKKLNTLLAALLFSPLCLFADPAPNPALQNLLDQYLSSHAISEGITAVSLGVSTGPGNFQSYYAGRTSSDPDAPIPNDTNLMQVGSITKSFISVLILQLEAQGKLNINDPISQYLKNADGSPLYPQWKNVTIKELLNMTSGIPDYMENQDLWNAYNNNYNPGPHWTPAQLVNFAAGVVCTNNPMACATEKGIFPPGSNWFYSNTNYILAGMIITQVTGQPVEYWLHNQLLEPGKLNLANTFYLPYSYLNLPAQYSNDNIPTRMIHGYDNQPTPGIPFPAGADLTDLDLSLAGAAGDISSNMQDITQWIQAIFSQNPMLQLTAKQYQELEAPVCAGTGPGNQCTPGQPVIMGPNITTGYSLGLFANYLPALGTFWSYEGDTWGYRFLWILVQNPKLPQPNLLVTATFNSASNNDDSGCLALNAIETIEGLPLANCEDSQNVISGSRKVIKE